MFTVYDVIGADWLKQALGNSPIPVTPQHEIVAVEVRLQAACTHLLPNQQSSLQTLFTILTCSHQKKAESEQVGLTVPVLHGGIHIKGLICLSSHCICFNHCIACQCIGNNVPSIHFLSYFLHVNTRPLSCHCTAIEETGVCVIGGKQGSLLQLGLEGRKRSLKNST